MVTYHFNSNLILNISLFISFSFFKIQPIVQIKDTPLTNAIRLQKTQSMDG